MRAWKNAPGRLWTDATGSVAIFVVAGFTGLLAFLAVVADGGFAFSEKRNLQNAADAAALAGALELPGDPQAAVTVAQTYADRNVSGLLTRVISISPDGVRITAEVSRNAAGLFNGWLSLGRPEVHAGATARVATPALPGPGVVPLAIPRDTYDAPPVQAGEPVTLKFAVPDQPPPPDCGLLDVVLVLDVSNSLDDQEFADLKDAAHQLVSAFPLDAVDGVRMGLVRFRGTSASVRTMTDDVGSLHGGINSLSRNGVGTGTNILAAVQGGGGQFTNAVTDRPAPNVIIVITDGNDSTGHSDATIAAAAAATGATVIAVGVGDEVSLSTLIAIAHPDDASVFSTETFNPGLLGLVNALAAAACAEAIPTSGGTALAGFLSLDGPGADVIRQAFIGGSRNPLLPVVDTESGNVIGPMLEGLQTRLEAAIASGCFTWAQVTASMTATDWPCGPLQAAAARADGVQSTSVILIPVIVENFADISPSQAVHVDQRGGRYETAYFWIDAAATFVAPLSGNWTCVSGPNARCEIVGRLLRNAPAALRPLRSGDVLLPYDASAPVRVVEIVD